jgi:hypothetical protein
MSKQAVLLIHGIGEQRPMDTLRGFVEAVWTQDKNLHRDHKAGAGVWSKPYSLSENFELRLLTTAENKAGRRTDFYELYWAHMMQGTKLAHVGAWAKSLLFRSPSSVPAHLRLAYWVLLALVAAGVYFAISGAIADAQGTLDGAVWLRYALGALVLPLGAWILISIVGDAARYLHVAPSNVQRRHEIRAAGMAVLKALHDAKYKYERIVVVGHSLGTVIGYDILTHTWAAYNAQEPKAPHPRYDSLSELEAIAVKLADREQVAIDEVQDAQRRYFNELRENQVPWKVTDFITLGSPLAHASILMADTLAKLQRRIDDREFPVCPPTLENHQRKGVAIRGFSYPAGAAKRFPHHAAVFGPTRWTNLYFPCRLLVWGDLIGGALNPLFGAAVRDVPVRTRARLGFLSHTLYWKLTGETDEHVKALRDALDLLDARHCSVPSPGAAPIVASSDELTEPA